MDSKVAFRPGDKLVVSLLNDLDHLKTQKDIRPIPRARLTEALIRSCARLMREHSADHLIVTSALWVLVSLVRMDAGARGLLSDAGVPGVLAEILHGSRVSRTTREYAGELTKVLCSQNAFEANGSATLGPQEGSFDDVYPSLHSLPGLSLGDSIGEQSSTLAQFVPYQLNSSNADALQSLFPSTLPPSRGGDSVASSSSYALPHREYDFSVAGSSSRAGPAKQRLPHDLRGSGLAYQSVMSTPYATDGVLRMIDKSPDGKKKNSRHSQTSQGVRPALRSGIASGRPNTSHMTASGSGIGGARNLSRTGSRRQVDRRFPLLHSGKSVNQMAATAADRSGFGRRDGLDGESTGEFRSTFDPAASFADMTSSLAKLDPLCLNLSAGLHPKRGTQSSSGGKRSAPALDGPSAASFDEEYNEFKPAGREQSWVSFAEGTMAESFNDYYEDGNKTGSRLFGGFSGDWQGQQLTQADVFNTAPQMASEFLVDTEFVRQLFIDGTTMEEAQNLVFKMQGVFELFDKDCTGVIDWNTFTKLILSMIPDRVLRADAVQFIAAQAEDPSSSIDYREFCLSGKVVVIAYKESVQDKKALSTVGWQHRQQAVTGDASTYTWKNHVEWYRDRKSKSLIWLMRRASRAILSFKRNLLAVDYLMYQGERARCLGFLMECGDRALAGTDVCKNTALLLTAKAKHSRRFILRRVETQSVLSKIGAAAIKAVQLEYERMTRRKRRQGVSGLQMVADGIKDGRSKKEPSGLQRTFSSFMQGEDMNDLGYSSDEEEKAAAKKRQDDLIAIALKKSKANLNQGYNRLHERHYRTSLAIQYLFNKGRQAIRLGYNKDDASAWLTKLGSRSCGQSRVTDKVFAYLAMKGQEAVRQSEISDNTFLSLSKTAMQYNKIYNKYLKAQAQLHRMAVLALRAEIDVAVLMERGRRWLMVCNQREHAFEYLRCRRRGAIMLVTKQRQAIDFLQAIPRKIWANIDRVDEAKYTLNAMGRKSVAAEIVHERVAAELRSIALRGTRGLERYRKTWAYLQQIGENARRQHFEKHWTIQSYNKPLLKEEETRVAQLDKDNKVIRRGWTRDERVKAEFEDAFEFLGMKPQRTRVNDRGGGMWADSSEDDTLLAIESRLKLYQISKTNFIQLTISGKLLGGGFDPAREFDALDLDHCGYIGFNDAWEWLQKRLVSISTTNAANTKKTAGDAEFCVNDILSVKSRVILALFEKYEGRNSRNR